MTNKIWNSNSDFETTAAGICIMQNGRLAIQDKKAFRERLIDELAWNSQFNTNEALRDMARKVICEASILFGCPSSSIHSLYMARARNEYKSATVPAINIRGLTFDVAQTIFRSMKKVDAWATIFEIAKSEIDYTKQRPAEYASLILAAAIKAGHEGPVFIQGDHFQVNAKKYAANPGEEIAGLKKLIEEAIAAGFYNIDIDSSTIVDLSKPSVFEQQRANFETCAELTRHIRKLEPAGVTISVGGEIGEVGGKNSTVEELTAFMEGYNKSIAAARVVGISKISVQTGTSHGGIPLPDGSIASVKLDFDVLEKLGVVAREQFHIGGVVQHGASTLPEAAFDNFPKRQTLEVHLATGYQNIIFDSKNFPADLRKKIYDWLAKNAAGDRKPSDTDEQFYYKTRKKGFGPFKSELSSLPDSTKSLLIAELEKTFILQLKKLNTAGIKKP